MVFKLFSQRFQRGFALLDLMLAIGVSAVIATAVLPYAGYQLSKAQTRAEARQLSAMAEIGLAYVQRDVAGAITDARAATTHTNLLQITETNLETAGLKPDFNVSKTPTGRDMTLWIYAPDENQAIILARATGDLPRGGRVILEGTYETGKIGAVFPGDDTNLRGPGVLWVLEEQGVTPPATGTGFQDVTGVSWPDENDIVALRHVDKRSTSDIYLHRQRVGSGSTVADENTMETTLSVQGDLNVGGNITANNMTLSSANLGSLTATDATLTTTTLTVADNVEIAGELEVTGTAEFSSIDAEDLTITGGLTGSGGMTITGDVSAANLVATNITVSGGEVNVTSVEAQNLEANLLEVGTTATFQGIETDKLAVKNNLKVEGEFRAEGNAQVDGNLRVHTLSVTGACVKCVAPTP